MYNTLEDRFSSFEKSIRKWKISTFLMLFTHENALGEIIFNFMTGNNFIFNTLIFLEKV